VSDLPEGALPLDAVSLFVSGDATVLCDPRTTAVFLARPTGAARRARRPARLLARRDLREALAAAARLTGGAHQQEAGEASLLLWQASALLAADTLQWAAGQPEARGIGARELARRMLAAARSSARPRSVSRCARQREAVHRALAPLAAARLADPLAPGSADAAAPAEPELRDLYVTTTCAATLTERWRVRVPRGWDGEDADLLALLAEGGSQVALLGEHVADEHERTVADCTGDPHAPADH
jgi:hypothetical protein